MALVNGTKCEYDELSGVVLCSIFVFWLLSVIESMINELLLLLSMWFLFCEMASLEPEKFILLLSSLSWFVDLGYMYYIYWWYEIIVPLIAFSCPLHDLFK